MKKKIFLLALSAIMLVCSCAYAFSDVKQGSWYYDNVTDMTENGYLKATKTAHSVLTEL